MPQFCASPEKVAGGGETQTFVVVVVVVVLLLLLLRLLLLLLPEKIKFWQNYYNGVDRGIIIINVYDLPLMR